MHFASAGLHLIIPSVQTGLANMYISYEKDREGGMDICIEREKKVRVERVIIVGYRERVRKEEIIKEREIERKVTE